MLRSEISNLASLDAKPLPGSHGAVIRSAVYIRVYTVSRIYRVCRVIGFRISKSKGFGCGPYQGVLGTIRPDSGLLGHIGPC